MPTVHSWIGDCGAAWAEAELGTRLWPFSRAQVLCRIRVYVRLTAYGTVLAA